VEHWFDPNDLLLGKAISVIRCAMALRRRIRVQEVER
jgi:hypothetical protein